MSASTAQAIALRGRAARLFAVVLAGAVLSAFALSNSYYTYVVNLSLINAIAAVGLVILTGVAGQLSLATAGLMAVGAYASVILTGQLGLPFIISAPAAAALTATLGTVLAAPALRLTGLHLAIVTLATGVIIVQVIGKGGELTGGMSGLSVDPAAVFGFVFDTETRRFVGLGLLLIAVGLVTANFRRLKPGRALLALRERETVAQMLGVDTRRYKMLAFAYSSFLSGLAGALYAAAKGYISVDDFTIWNSIYFYVMIAVGGATSVIGGIVGALFVTMLPEFLRGFDEASQAVFGVILVIVIVFLPKGVVPLLAGWMQKAISAPAQSDTR